MRLVIAWSHKRNRCEEFEVNNASVRGFWACFLDDDESNSMYVGKVCVQTRVMKNILEMVCVVVEGIE